MKIFKENLFRLPLFLGVVVAISAFLLGLTYELTKDQIDKNNARSKDANFYEVFRDVDVDHFVGIDLEAVDESLVKNRVREARAAYDKQDNLVGYAVLGAAMGFQDEIQVIVAFAPTGDVIGYLTSSCNDTAGYGTKLLDADSEAFMYLLLKTGDDAFKSSIATGATISRNGAIKAANNAHAFIMAYIALGGN